MQYLTINITGSRAEAGLTLYLLDNYLEIDPRRKRPMVVICPGGAYRFISDREAEAIAVQVNAMGCHAAVLRYSCAPERYPEPLLQLARSVVTIRSRADEWAVNPDEVYVLGFSAGGHLAASLGVFWNSEDLSAALELDNSTFKPNRLILCYPVISSGPFAHTESLENITGSKRDKPTSLWEHLSLEKQVSADTPPTFLWHTVEDPNVPAENSLLFATALRAHHVPFELHIYQKGGHGLSLGNKEVECKATRYPNQPNIRSWIRLLRTWLERDEY
jgi:acetyl esterase/lipase